MALAVAAAEPARHAGAVVGRRAGAAPDRLRRPAPEARPESADRVAPKRGARAGSAGEDGAQARRERVPARLLRQRRRADAARVRRRGEPAPGPGAASGRGTAVSSTDGRRPTRDARAYSDGSDAIRPAAVRVEHGRDISGERTVRVGACVIGTGAGGAPVAKELAEGGMTVALRAEGEGL